MENALILVVDDDVLVADFIARFVLPKFDFHAVTARNGAQALDIIRRQNVALILLDFELPDMSGLDLLRRLVEKGYWIPTIMITGHGSEKVAVEAFRLGVQDYLSKPIDEKILYEAINRGLTSMRLKREKELLTAELHKQISWLETYSQISKSITSTLETDEVLRRIVAAGVELTEAQEGFLALLEPTTGQLYLRAVKNIDEQVSKSIRLPVEDSLIGEVVQTANPVRISQFSDENLLKVSTGFLVHSLLYVPMISKGRVIGVLAVDNPTAQSSFTDEDEARLTDLADYAALAIQNASLYAQAQEEIAERKRVEQALRESEERYALAVQGANDGLWDWDLRTNLIYFSPRWKSILGLADGDVGRDPDEWYNRVHCEDVERLKLDISAHMAGLTPHFENEHRILHRDGEYRWVQSRAMAVRDEDGVAYRMAGSLTDITDRKNAEQRLLHDAFHDTLTGLPNRALFLDRLSLAVERSKRRKDFTYAVLFLDLDRFKDINDTLGHMLGDQLLVHIGNMLANGLRSTDTVARLGGDEFVILMEDISDFQGILRVADWIHEKLKAPIPLRDHQVFISTSIGIVSGGLNYARPEDILRDADIAMYSAKAHGRARSEIFEPDMRVRISQRLLIESELRQAIEREEFVVHYQPIVALESGQITGFEALIRWQHPTRGLLNPAEFLFIAEETGLIIPIDRWVLRKVCSQMKSWQDSYPINPPLTVSVNLSGKEISKPDLVDYIQKALEESGLNPGCLKLEITENVIMETSLFTSEVFRRLQALGVQVQIDDFGIGYSSLSYLSQFPVNALKIDQSFINKMAVDNSQLKIIQAIVMLAHRLDVVVVAEGVENEEQMARLRALGCEYGQGYFVSKPLDTTRIQTMLDEWSRAGVQPAHP